MACNLSASASSCYEVAQFFSELTPLRGQGTDQAHLKTEKNMGWEVREPGFQF